jgi:hypothetical protein
MAIGDLVTEDWGFEFRGFAFGGTSDLQVAPGLTGLFDNPDVVNGDRRRLRRHGLHPGDDFYAGREIVIPIEIVGDDTADWATNLANLKRAMDVDPDAGEEPLVFQVPGVAGGGKRRVLARPRGLAAPVDLNWYYEIPIATARFACSSPDILDNTATTVTSPILTGGSSGATWDWTWDLSWGTVFTTSFFTTNSGTRRAEWTATIPGPVEDPRITHVGEGAHLEFVIDIAAGDELIVDSATRTVLLNGTSNRYSTLTPDSDWFTLPPGSNELGYSADVGTSTISIVFHSAWS